MLDTKSVLAKSDKCLQYLTAKIMPINAVTMSLSVQLHRVTLIFKRDVNQ